MYKQKDYRQRDISNRLAVTDSNADPITGESGSHPIATGIGAAIVGTFGTAVGALVGPFGAFAGAAIGSVLGGLAGKSAAEAVHPTLRERFRRSTPVYRTSIRGQRDERHYQSDRIDSPRTLIQSDDDRAFSEVQPFEVPLTQHELKPVPVSFRNRSQSSPLFAGENDYWRQEYRNRPYYESGLSYADYQPAYRVGYESYEYYRRTGMSYDEAEPALRQSYERNPQSSRLGWDKAKYAVRDAWERAEQALRHR